MPWPIGTAYDQQTDCWQEVHFMFEVILSCMSSHFELQREVKRGNTCRVREILKSGAVINAKDRSGFTPLMHALGSPMASGELVELLLDSGRRGRRNYPGWNGLLSCVRRHRRREPDQAGYSTRPRRGPALYEEARL